MATMPLPSDFARPGWYTASFVACKLGRPIRTVQYWCRTGFFLKRGCKVIYTFSRNRNWGREYWIYIPLMSKDAMLSKVSIDTPPSIPYPLKRADGGSIAGSGAITLR